MTSTDSHMNRFYNTRESALNILEVLARQRPFVLQIQSEVVDDKREIIDTVAGRFLDEELFDNLRDSTEKLTTLQNKLKTSQTQHDENLTRLVEQEKEEIETMMEECLQQQEGKPTRPLR